MEQEGSSWNKTARPSSGFDGTHGVQFNTATMVDTPNSLPSFILRVVAIVTAFLATIVMGVAKETKLVGIPAGSVPVELTVKTTGSGNSQFEYFIGVNAVALVYAAASLVLSIFTRRSSSRNQLTLILAIVDLVIVALLFSGIGTASAMGVLGQRDSIGEGATCDLFKKFCERIAGAIVMSMFGALAFLGLVLVHLVGLHRRSI